MPKKRCPRCKRKMLVESENNEQCTSETCDYFVDYTSHDHLFSTCKHCGEPIALDPTFGWIHGVMGAGWNTSCADDEHLAEPKDMVPAPTTNITMDEFLKSEKESSDFNERRSAYYKQLLKDYDKEEESND